MDVILYNMCKNTRNNKVFSRTRVLDSLIHVQNRDLRSKNHLRGK